MRVTSMTLQGWKLWFLINVQMLNQHNMFCFYLTLFCTWYLFVRSGLKSRRSSSATNSTIKSYNLCAYVTLMRICLWMHVLYVDANTFKSAQDLTFYVLFRSISSCCHLLLLMQSPTPTCRYSNESSTSLFPEELGPSCRRLKVNTASAWGTRK